MESPAINRGKLEFKVRFACWIHPMLIIAWLLLFIEKISSFVC